MAVTPKTLAVANNVGTTQVTLYTVPASTTTVITGFTISNVTTSREEIDLVVDRGGTEYSILNDTRIDRRDSLTFSGHIVLDTAGDSLKAMADAANSFDITVSGWEET